MTYAPVDRSKLARNDQEYRDLLSSDADWIARAPDDLRQLRDSKAGPLAKLPEDDFREFVDGLEFEEQGVCGGSYRVLMSSLTISEALEVFERFGMSQEYALACLEEKCVNGTCEFSFWDFCSSLCQPIIVATE